MGRLGGSQFLLFVTYIVLLLFFLINEIVTIKLHRDRYSAFVCNKCEMRLSRDIEYHHMCARRLEEVLAQKKSLCHVGWFHSLIDASKLIYVFSSCRRFALHGCACEEYIISDIPGNIKYL